MTAADNPRCKSYGQCADGKPSLLLAPMENLMSAISVLSRSALISAAVFAASITAIGTAQAAVTKAQLAGNWTAALGGNTGCGSTSMYVQFNLNTGGNGTATIISHSTGCADRPPPAIPSR